MLELATRCRTVYNFLYLTLLKPFTGGYTWLEKYKFSRFWSHRHLVVNFSTKYFTYLLQNAWMLVECLCKYQFQLVLELTFSELFLLVLRLVLRLFRDFLLSRLLNYCLLCISWCLSSVILLVLWKWLWQDQYHTKQTGMFISFWNLSVATFL